MCVRRTTFHEWNALNLLTNLNLKLKCTEQPKIIVFESVVLCVAYLNLRIVSHDFISNMST